MATKKDAALIIKEESSPIVSQASKLSIKTPAEMKKAAEILSKLNRYNDDLVADMKKVTDPLNAALKEVRSRYNPVKTVLEEAIDIIRSKMGDYQTEATRIADAEKAKIAARVGDGKGKLRVETAIAQMEDVDAPAAKVETESGSLKFRPQQKLKIMDETLIPREYLILNEKKILDDLKAGINVLGAVIEIVQVPVNSRN